LPGTARVQQSSNAVLSAAQDVQGLAGFDELERGMFSNHVAKIRDRVEWWTREARNDARIMEAGYSTQPKNCLNNSPVSGDPLAGMIAVDKDEIRIHRQEMLDLHTRAAFETNTFLQTVSPELAPADQKRRVFQAMALFPWVDAEKKTVIAKSLCDHNGRGTHVCSDFDRAAPAPRMTSETFELRTGRIALRRREVHRVKHVGQPRPSHHERGKQACQRPRTFATAPTSSAFSAG